MSTASPETKTQSQADRALGRAAELDLDDRKVLCLLDGMALAYRGHFALINNPVMTSSGMNTSAPLVFINTLLEFLEKFEPTHIAAVFDAPGPTHRHVEFAEYKATRDRMPEDLSSALPYVFKLLEAFQIPVLRVEGWEADDVIGTLARRADSIGMTTYMVTPDKDFAQLVSQNTWLYRPGRAGKPADLLGEDDVLAKWKIQRVDQIIDLLGLMGDTSDNVPGVPGIGEKTAQKLLADFDTVEDLLDRLDELKGKRKETLVEFADQARLSKRLVTIETEVPLDVEVEDLKRSEADQVELTKLFSELEFNALGKRLFGDDFEAGVQRMKAGVEDPHQVKSIAEVEHDYRLVDGVEARTELIAELQDSDRFALDLETTSLNPKTCQILGLAVSTKAHTGAFVLFPEDESENRAVLEELRPLLEGPGVKVGHNLKFDVTVLRWHGVGLGGTLCDTMVAAFLATPDLRRSMDYLAQALLGYRPIPISDLIGERGSDQRSMRDVPIEDLTEYAAEDADIALQLWERLEPLLAESEQAQLYQRVEAPLIPVLAAMEHAGIRVDPEILKVISDDLAQKIESSAARIEELAGEPFNLNSPQQLGQILFEKLDLDPNARRTAKSKQYKTDEMVLTRLSHEHEIARQILDYRLCTKLKSTYLDMLPGAIFSGSGRIHTHYEQAVAATGRMQSSGPNLQNIPIRTEQGREIRKAFVPGGPEYTLLSADYSQIELRIIAEISGDERMNEAFSEEEDIHTVTASRIYNVPPSMVDDDMRRQSKTVNFGIIYGISAFGLSERLGLPRKVGQQFIEQYFEEYPGVRRYMDETVEFCRENGYVRTLNGRRRYLKDINSRNRAIRSAAERNAINSPIQGTAADMIKLAMVTIHQQQLERGWKTRMLLQVHDELVFDLYQEEEAEVRQVVEEAMQQAIPMKVPIVVEMGTGPTWLEAH
ncbi:MAG TPA: DNA polymerase I [Candidatus Latescibacteria bacterium]|jgi:DNA polymerase-1|nr:DNA polymerase I [Gemmatimonadaceae bacterium]MDP6018138.1 DNA polymerase I [Candidatus Latescibacterota bacterium]HJP29400.1 DNA polymerase I [Candidatus Latescibacterota bacterium]